MGLAKVGIISDLALYPTASITDMYCMYLGLDLQNLATEFGEMFNLYSNLMAKL